MVNHGEDPRWITNDQYATVNRDVTAIGWLVFGVRRPLKFSQRECGVQTGWRHGGTRSRSRFRVTCVFPLGLVTSISSGLCTENSWAVCGSWVMALPVAATTWCGAGFSACEVAAARLEMRAYIISHGTAVVTMTKHENYGCQQKQFKKKYIFYTHSQWWK